MVACDRHFFGFLISHTPYASVRASLHIHIMFLVPLNCLVQRASFYDNDGTIGAGKPMNAS